jgi:hypothetical protein
MFISLARRWTAAGIVRKRPVPIPGNGMQLTNIAHVRDLASMLALAVENPGAAAGKVFNCVSDRAVTLDGMARLCATAAGADVEIVHYDPAAVGVEAKKAFPFRNMVSAVRCSPFCCVTVRWRNVFCELDAVAVFDAAFLLGAARGEGGAGVDQHDQPAGGPQGAVRGVRRQRPRRQAHDLRP